jgi:hypothetical protein
MNATTCIKSQSWLTAVTRSTSIVPAHGFGMGDVRPMGASAFAATAVLVKATDKRHADAVKATPVQGHQPWSPPVT